MKDTKLKTKEQIKSFNEILEHKSGANNTNSRLKVKFVEYDLPTLDESDEKSLLDFIVLLVQCGFQGKIVNGNFQERKEGNNET